MPNLQEKPHEQVPKAVPAFLNLTDHMALIPPS